MKRGLLLFLAFTSMSFAGELLCNDGTTDNYGAPVTSCIASSSNFTFGLTQEADGSAYYYFVDFHDVLLTIDSEENVPLRLIVYSSEPNFNSIQALTQTAFATNSKLQVIFKSPALPQNFSTTGPNEHTLCYRFSGAGGSVVCHVDALTLQR